MFAGESAGDAEVLGPGGWAWGVGGALG